VASQIAGSLMLGGAEYKFLALAYNNKFRSKDLQMDMIAELRAGAQAEITTHLVIGTHE